MQRTTLQSRIALIGGCALKKSRGQPKVFEEQEFKDFVFQYLNEVYQNQNTDDPDVPTFFGFYNFVKERKEYVKDQGKIDQLRSSFK